MWAVGSNDYSLPSNIILIEQFIRIINFNQMINY